MKKIFLIITTIILLITLSACSKSNKTNTTTESTTTTTVSTTEAKISAGKAKQLAIEHVKEWGADGIISKFSHIKSIKNFEVTDAEVKETYKGYEVTVKGNFYAYDEYGRLKDRYIFTWENLPVSETGNIYDTNGYLSLKISRG